MYYVLLPLQPQSFAESRHAHLYEGHIEKQKEIFRYVWAKCRDAWV